MTLETKKRKVKVWLEFVLIGHKPKTKIYAVFSTCSLATELGRIGWYPAWRHYCFSPTLSATTVFSDRCLFEIAEFVKKLNEEHKAKKKGEL